MKKKGFANKPIMSVIKKSVEPSSSKQKDFIIELVFTILIASLIIFFIVILT